jgi:hypothetical protein
MQFFRNVVKREATDAVVHEIEYYASHANWHTRILNIETHLLAGTASEERWVRTDSYWAISMLVGPADPALTDGFETIDANLYAIVAQEALAETRRFVLTPIDQQ